MVHEKGPEVHLGRLCKTSGDAGLRSWPAPSLWKSPQGSTHLRYSWGGEKVNMSQHGKGVVRNIVQHSFKRSRVLLFRDCAFEPNTGQRAS